MCLVGAVFFFLDSSAADGVIMNLVWGGGGGK